MRTRESSACALVLFVCAAPYLDYTNIFQFVILSQRVLRLGELCVCVHTILMQCIRTDNAYNPKCRQTNVKWRKPMLNVSSWSESSSLPLPLPNEMPFAFDYNYYLVSRKCAPTLPQFHAIQVLFFYLHHLHHFLFLYNKYLTFTFTFVDTFNDEIVSFSIKMEEYRSVTANCLC